MPKLFFDTEFTSLSDDARLISIGVIDETGRGMFYAECSDTFAVDDCSQFCRRVVLPLLEGGDAQMPLTELRTRLTTWLGAFDDNVVLICDSRRDVTQLMSIFPDGIPANCLCQVLGYWGNMRRSIVNVGRRLHRKHGLRVHHALDDARVNRIIFSSWNASK